MRTYEYNDGFYAVWDDSYYRPVKDQPPRQFVATARLTDEAEWLRGYDDGMELCKQYANGRAGEFFGYPFDRSQLEAWRFGWLDGRRAFVRKWLLNILKIEAAPIKMIVVETHYPVDDPVDGYREGGKTAKPLTRRWLLEECIESMSKIGIKNEELPTTVGGMIDWFVEAGESEWGRRHVIPKKEYLKEEAQREYEKMSQLAEAFAAKHNRVLGTMSFLMELKRAIRRLRNAAEHWNSGECRMEEWAAHMHAGAGHSSYFDDLNYANDRYHNELDDLQKIWDYMRRKFPILIARYEERRLKRRT